MNVVPKEIAAKMRQGVPVHINITGKAVKAALRNKTLDNMFTDEQRLKVALGPASRDFRLIGKPDDPDYASEQRFARAKAALQVRGSNTLKPQSEIIDQ